MELPFYPSKPSLLHKVSNESASNRLKKLDHRPEEEEGGNTSAQKMKCGQHLARGTPTGKLFNATRVPIYREAFPEDKGDSLSLLPASRGFFLGGKCLPNARGYCYYFRLY